MAGLALSDSYRRYLETATDRYHEQLLSQEGASALTYLEEERGLKKEVIKRFRLGYVADPLAGHEHLRGRIAIPYLTPDYSTVDMKFRSIDGRPPKYMKLNGPRRMYNTPALERGTSGILVCEGEIDAITAEQCGFPAVGIPGSETWVPIWYRLFLQYSVVYMLADGDDAGRHLYDMVSERLDNVRLIPFADGEDVNSFVLKHGVEGLRRKLNL